MGEQGRSREWESKVGVESGRAREDDGCLRPKIWTWSNHKQGHR